MNTLPSFDAIGMPWHGLAVNGQLATSEGSKAVNSAFAAGHGACIVQRNPSAPGASRNAAQAAQDAAKGRQWRDYILLCGGERAVNGSQDAEIGGNGWLYCDANGLPWVVTLEQARNGGQLDLELWRRGLFGRFGNQPGITDELIATFAWTPTIPAWLTGLTATQIVAGATANRHQQLVISPAGDDVIVNIMGTGYDVFTAIPETQTSSGSLLSVLRITISGDGDIAAGGAGVNANIVEEDTLANLVTFVSTGFPDDDLLTWGYTTLPPIAPDYDGSAPLETVDWTVDIVVAGATGNPSVDVGTWIETDAVCYRTHRGDITRQQRAKAFTRYERTLATGARSYTVTWQWVKMSGSTEFHWVPITGDAYDDGFFQWEERTSSFEETLIAYSYGGFTESVHVVKEYVGNTRNETFPDQGVADSTDGYQSMTCNGESYVTPLNVYPRGAAVVRANNLFGLTSDFRLPDGVNRRYTQRWIGDGESAATSVLLKVDAWANSGDPDGFIPPQIGFASFQPVTMEFSYSTGNDRYQYV